MSKSIGTLAKMFVAAVVLAQVGTADAAEIRVLCAAGMQPIMQDLGSMFERATGHKLAMTFATGGATIKRVQGGEATDVVIAIQQGIAGLAKAGKVAPDSIVVLASTGINMAVRKGPPKPDVSSPEALKRALLAAKSVTYLNPADGGESGIHFAKVLDMGL